MDLKELVELIAIKNYVAFAVDNFALDRETVKYMNDSKIMLDKKVIGILKSDEFKEYIEYQNVQGAVQEVRRLTDIKSSLKK